MESRVNYTMVGAFIVLLGLALITIVIWLSVGLSDKRYDIYKVYLNESVTGLNVNAPVRYNGVDVGSVKKVELNRYNPNLVIITLEIEDGTPVKIDTRATLMSQGLTGVSFLNLSGGSVKSPMLQPKPGDSYPVIQTVPSLLVRLDTTVRQLSESLAEVSKGLQSVFDTDNRASFKSVLHNLDKVSTTLAVNAAQMDQSMKSVNIILDNSAKASKQLPESLKHLDEGSLAVTQMSKRIAQTGLETTQTMSLLNEQAIPQAMQTLSSIQSLSEHLKSLTSDIQQNPSMLVRGRQPAKLGPGE